VTKPSKYKYHSTLLILGHCSLVYLVLLTIGYIVSFKLLESTFSLVSLKNNFLLAGKTLKLADNDKRTGKYSVLENTAFSKEPNYNLQQEMFYFPL
jgi:hypothetical protein